LTHPHRSIRFTSTEDGVGIAFWEIGEGKPVVILNNFTISHAELEWTVPSIASFYMDMADRYRVIRYDPRGFGLSGELPGGSGAVSETGAQLGMSPHEMGLDISAVVNALGIDSFALLANSIQGPVAIEYAAKHSEVSELILCESMASPASSSLAPMLQADMALAKIASETGQAFSVWEKVAPHEEIEQVLNLARNSNLLGGSLIKGTRAVFEWDSDQLLGEISVPTLILSGRDMPVDTLSDARHLAAGIEGSQLRVLDGGLTPWFCDRGAVIDAMVGLLGPGRNPTIETEPSAPESSVTPDKPVLRDGRILVTVLFTDIVDSTSLQIRLGDREWSKLVEAHHAVVRKHLDRHGGLEQDTAGDGFYAVFNSPAQAIEAVQAIMGDLTDLGVEIRAGVHTGECAVADGKCTGVAVSTGARIMAAAGPSEILVSQTVHDLIAGGAIDLEEAGVFQLKGIPDRQRLHRVARG
jgi:class 3 adenylate cyclase/pimeloyl-ACP methyl ester carboxylesterase